MYKSPKPESKARFLKSLQYDDCEPAEFLLSCAETSNDDWQSQLVCVKRQVRVLEMLAKLFPKFVDRDAVGEFSEEWSFFSSDLSSLAHAATRRGRALYDQSNAARNESVQAGAAVAA